jgi:membrane protein implicated in regulation of membrane protease activity
MKTSDVLPLILTWVLWSIGMWATDQPLSIWQVVFFPVIYVLLLILFRKVFERPKKAP